MEEKQCLILGPQSSGKTLLIKRLQALSSSEVTASRDQPLPPTQPTTGTNLVTIATPHGPILLKEYGGKMAPLWPKALPKADMLIFVIDTGNQWQLSMAVVLLMETLGNEAVDNKPVLLFFNKTDVPSPLNLDEYLAVTRVEDLRVKYGSLLTVISGSCCLSCEKGPRDVMKWLHERRSEFTREHS